MVGCGHSVAEQVSVTEPGAVLLYRWVVPCVAVKSSVTPCQVEVQPEFAGNVAQSTCWENSDTGPKIGSAGAYFDKMVKVDGKWFIQHRRIDRFIAEGKF